MRHRAHLLISAALVALGASAQPTVVQQGKPFSKPVKGGTGDLYTVVDGLFSPEGRHLLYVEEGLVPKLVRLDALLQPAEELALKDLLVDGQKWTGVMPLVANGRMQVLLASGTKKGTAFAMAECVPHGAPALGPLRRIAVLDLPYSNDPAHTMAVRPLPDPILFSRGLAFAQDERLIAAPDGKHRLLNHCSHQGKGPKRLALAWLDEDLTVLWQSTVELPYEDAQSTIHQTVVDDDGTVRLLAYVFPCKGDGQLSDKNCHELHLTTIAENGKAVSDVLLEKDFVSSARLLLRDNGRIALALRYGALTGQAGQVITFDPNDPKLKPTPVAAQRLPGIRKTKLLAYGDPTADPRKPPARNAKVPDEVVSLFPADDGGLVAVETYLDYAFQLPVGEAFAMRHLSGPVRVTRVLPNDSIGWQRVVERTLMTTAGQAYEGCAAERLGDRLLLLHGHTPKGYPAILRAGAEAAGSKDPDPAQPLVLKAAMIDLRTGEVKAEGTALLEADGFIPCPMGVVHEPNGQRALVKAHDRGNRYRFTVIDLAKLGEER
jgi:hypothetical protein